MKKFSILALLVVVAFALSFPVCAQEEYMTDSGEIRDVEDGEVMTESGEIEDVGDDGEYMDDSGEIDYVSDDSDPTDELDSDLSSDLQNELAD